MSQRKMKRRYPDKSRILLVNITRLGDMLQATPTIAGMKMENPDCHITVLVEKQFESVCRSIPGIDEVLSLDLGMTVRALAREGEGIIDAYEYVGEFVDDLKSREFDYCLNMSSSAYTAVLLNLLGIERRGGWTSDDEGYRLIETDWARLFATSVFHQNRSYNSLNLVDVFRCSADVEQHPHNLLIKVLDEDREYCRKFIEESNFTNTGPLVVIQAGASQGKRQWALERFIRLIDQLTEENNVRVVLTGTQKELNIIDPIKQGCASGNNVAVAAGKTNIPQLSALLEMADILVTGDTGPMHICVAVGTPVVAMFLASAFGFETGPYSEGNIVLQPVLECGPCNPNKPCARPDCHDLIEPELIAKLAMMRVKEDFKKLPDGFADPNRVIVYRTFFDEYGFYDMTALNVASSTEIQKYREAYRQMWLDDIAGLVDTKSFSNKSSGTNGLNIISTGLAGLEDIIKRAGEGERLIAELEALIKDVHSPPRQLAVLTERLGELDKHIEYLGYHHSHLGPLTRMFVFAKENLSGSEALSLASQMGAVYEDLLRRGDKLSHYYQRV